MKQSTILPVTSPNIRKMRHKNAQTASKMPIFDSLSGENAGWQPWYQLVWVHQCLAETLITWRFMIGSSVELGHVMWSLPFLKPGTHVPSLTTRRYASSVSPKLPKFIQTMTA